MPFSRAAPNSRREVIERTLTRAAILLVVMATPLLWYVNYVKEQSSFSALSAANILLLQKVSEFEVHQTIQTALVLSKQAEMFQRFESQRLENISNWTREARETADNTAAIRQDMAELRNDLVGRFDLLDARISDTAQILKVNSAVTRARADTAVKKLNQKVLTGADAEALRHQAEELKQQNKELKHTKSVFRLLPW